MSRSWLSRSLRRDYLILPRASTSFKLKEFFKDFLKMLINDGTRIDSSNTRIYNCY